MNDIKAVIFDMDGTLMDNIPFHKKAWLTFLRKYGYNENEQDFLSKIQGTPWIDLLMCELRQYRKRIHRINNGMQC